MISNGMRHAAMQTLAALSEHETNMNVGFVFDLRIAAPRNAIYQNGTFWDILGQGSSQLAPGS
jgi:hypothetical protein